MTRSSWKPWEKRQGDDSTGATRSWPVPSRGNGDEEGEDASFWQAMAYLTSLGWVLALPVAAGILLGAWLDRQLGTTPTLTLGLLGAGIVIAAVQAYLMVAEAHEEGKRS
ncbi:AtpZ/AtpI family protein [Salinigranum marinum]|uniref:AtpZ/AtpI family protein n=1 Tax=Salinigranum marinum TaxID=1515595 RepID=UPI002989D41A|nr:AtpZ/AtpI family protein [Salinigranum marinum]